MALVGGGCGKVKGGSTALSRRNAGVEHAVDGAQSRGVPIESLGDSTGEIAEV